MRNFDATKRHVRPRDFLTRPAFTGLSLPISDIPHDFILKSSLSDNEDASYKPSGLVSSVVALSASCFVSGNTFSGT
jgi:hypothetical protein